MRAATSPEMASGTPEETPIYCRHGERWESTTSQGLSDAPSSAASATPLTPLLPQQQPEDPQREILLPASAVEPPPGRFWHKLAAVAQPVWELALLPTAYHAACAVAFAGFVLVLLPWACAAAVPLQLAAALRRDDVRSRWRVTKENRDALERIAAAEIDPRIRLEDFALSGGDSAVLHHISAGPEPAEGGPDPVVMLHGANATSLGLAPMLLAFAEQGRHAVAIDWPYAGRTDGSADWDAVGAAAPPAAHPAAPRGSATERCDRIVDVVAAFIQQRYGGRRVVAVGHSFGGFLALRLAYRYPALCCSLIQAAPPGTLRSFGESGGLYASLFDAGVLPRPLRFLGNAWTWAAFAFLKRDALAFYKLQVMCARDCSSDRVVGAFVERQGWWRYRWRETMLAELLGLQLPAASVWGDNDSVCPAAHGALLADLTASPVFIARDCGHGVLGTPSGVAAMLLAADQAAPPEAAEAAAPAVRSLEQLGDWSTLSPSGTRASVSATHRALRDACARGGSGRVTYVGRDGAVTTGAAAAVELR
eukprot:TRINITY_DN5027_c6_g1_i1.p1 TRINITY_DN5027_c6_g1~~TRINITY_DN5027_c6_g1_i1.p1  ORF type:complete len:563 (+),score=155.65 TRINITY_DN5027_c6_g1_i1:84-1691(+)